MTTFVQFSKTIKCKTIPSLTTDSKSKYVITTSSVKQGILKGFCFHFTTNAMHSIFFHVHYTKKNLNKLRRKTDLQSNLNQLLYLISINFDLIYFFFAFYFVETDS